MLRNASISARGMAARAEPAFPRSAAAGHGDCARRRQWRWQVDGRLAHAVGIDVRERGGNFAEVFAGPEVDVDGVVAGSAVALTVLAVIMRRWVGP